MLHEKRHRSLHQESLYAPFQARAINDNHESKLDIMLLFGENGKKKRNGYIYSVRIQLNEKKRKLITY